jgi:hypothetical protein
MKQAKLNDNDTSIGESTEGSNYDVEGVGGAKGTREEWDDGDLTQDEGMGRYERDRVVQLHRRARRGRKEFWVWKGGKCTDGRC